MIFLEVRLPTNNFAIYNITKYVAPDLAAREAAYTASVTDELMHFEGNIRPIRIYGDNKASISLACKPIVDVHSKHICIKYH